jgi:hypothetical protein
MSLRAKVTVSEQTNLSCCQEVNGDRCPYKTPFLRWEGAVRAMLLHYRANHKDTPLPIYPKHNPNLEEMRKKTDGFCRGQHAVMEGIVNPITPTMKIDNVGINHKKFVLDRHDISPDEYDVIMTALRNIGEEKARKMTLEQQKRFFATTLAVTKFKQEQRGATTRPL